MRQSKQQRPIPILNMSKIRVDYLAWTTMPHHLRLGFYRKRNVEAMTVDIFGLFEEEVDR
jgi:hypothetical protein